MGAWQNFFLFCIDTVGCQIPEQDSKAATDLVSAVYCRFIDCMMFFGTANLYPYPSIDSFCLAKLKTLKANLLSLMMAARCSLHRIRLGGLVKAPHQLCCGVARSTSVRKLNG